MTIPVRRSGAHRRARPGTQPVEGLLRGQLRGARFAQPPRHQLTAQTRSANRAWFTSWPLVERLRGGPVR